MQGIIMEREEKVRVGLVGAGFMGKCHANAFRSVRGLFPDVPEVELSMLADVDAAAAAANARHLGFKRSTGDWRMLVGDSAIDIVAVTTPNVLHEPVVLEAISCGKTVYCEKPLSTTSESARQMYDAARCAGIVNVVGFNFLRNPMIRLAKEIIVSGEIGEILSFRGAHRENYMCDPEAPHSFRTDPLGGGALADIGSHIISMARYLLGNIVRVCGHTMTFFSERAVTAGGREKAPVHVDDAAYALLEFESGVSGSLEANWAAFGRTMDLSFEITGTHGALVFSQERMNELLVCDREPRRGLGGFRRVEAGPDHPPYDRFCPAPGHHLGFNDLKVIEVAHVLGCHVSRTGGFPDFKEAYDVQRTVEAVRRSSTTRTWLEVE